MNKNGEKLDKYCLISSGGTPSKKNLSYYENGSILWATIADMEKSDGIVLDTKLKIAEKGLSSIGNRIFPKDTLFLAMYGSVGKVAIAGKEMAVNQAILGIQPKNEHEIFIPYLKYWLMHNKPKVVNKARGGILKNLSAKIVKNLKIELPSYSDQKNIANLLTQVEALIAKREKSIELLDELLRSSFLDMFGDPVLNNKGWKVQPLHKVCTKIIGGGTPSKSNPNFYTGTIPWVTAKDMKFEYIIDSIDHITEAAIKKSSANLIPINSLLMVTRSGILKKKLPLAINKVEVTMNQDMKAFIVNNDLINVEFFYHFLFSYQHYLLKKIRSVTVDNLKFDDVKKISVYLPPKPLQDKFATIVKQVESTKEQYQNSLDELRDLFGSLSQRAFRGELDLGDKKKVSALDFKIELGKSVENNLSFASKIKDLGVKFPKLGIDTSSLGIGSKLAEGIVNIDASSRIIGDFSLVGKEYNALHETLSSFGRAKMTDIFPSMSESLASSFMTNEQFSKSLLGNALELDKYTKALTSNYFKTWKQEEEDRLSNLIARPTLGLSSSELWKNKISDAIGSNALSNLESVYGVNSAIETMNMWKHENERLQVSQISDYVKAEQEKFNQLAGLGKYDEQIHDFTQKYKSLFEASTSASDLIKDYESLQTHNISIEFLGVKALNEALEVEQPYKLALERAEAMNPLREWGERHEALINRYSEKLEETTEVIESIFNLSELIDDELFDDISWKDSYDDIKELVYKLVDEGKLEQVFERRLLVQNLKKLQWFKSIKELTVKDFNYQWIKLCQNSEEEKSVVLKKVEQ